MTLHLGLATARHNHSSSSSNGEQAQEVREARRLLRERIRNDWDFPTLPAYKSCGRSRDPLVSGGGGGEEDEDENLSVEERIAGFRFHTPGTHHLDNRTRDGSGQALGLDFDPVGWRERQYSSESDTEVDENASAAAPAATSSARSKSSTTYKFEGPDSVGAQLKDRRLAKKRKRSRAKEEEMQWNDGLAHWMRRRDAWCCARTAAQVHMSERSSASANSQQEHVDYTSASASSSPRSSTSSAAGHQPSSTPGSSLATTPDITAARTEATPTTVASPVEEVLVPIAPCILPNHPIRRKITPNMYPEIYTKIILQSRTPSVPINLQALVKALIQGWKDDGEWPPKSAPLEKSIGRKKGSHHPGGLKEGVKAVGRVLRLTGVGESNK
ncbi:Hypothetical predicted protein [Lecanosticta acicola]|uniref:Gag1-like clamp domain-containing protein n=1 Tax=Lecanosticta acicola TaxID=111012 RepID=A0AAI8Z6X4_9PEZI|nr:Hypothetical predicted protein [Lecanosticta acicola]